MVKVNLSGKMVATTKETLYKVNLKGLASIFSLILTKFMKENLEIAAWKVKAKKYGVMVENMKEILKMVKKTEKVLLNGQMEINILGLGDKENNTE